MPGFADGVPYLIAIVELEQVPQLMCCIRDAAREEVRKGLAVKVVLEAVAPEVTLPFFRPAADRESPTACRLAEGTAENGHAASSKVRRGCAR